MVYSQLFSYSGDMSLHRDSNSCLKTVLPTEMEFNICMEIKNLLKQLVECTENQPTRLQFRGSYKSGIRRIFANVKYLVNGTEVIFPLNDFQRKEPRIDHGVLKKLLFFVNKGKLLMLRCFFHGKLSWKKINQLYSTDNREIGYKVMNRISNFYQGCLHVLGIPKKNLSLNLNLRVSLNLNLQRMTKNQIVVMMKTLYPATTTKVTLF